ncbi:GPI-anchored wall transfer protein 1 [Lindgomyces ingoldianus]|uniref:GPI-anchored wall transfer protein 1 n=1 Tax=Lindgomyces ingoldianus TaxID=673940 RepID=A0ACB6QVA7_9PLEO|nr:GPI-anchored wall transfer protein 1 [Lindgomyces ingoldianus]KAF2470974.1 GPI-anchored wall transfer protein 1 [Lindgomyces ingoldianus]
MARDDKAQKIEWVSNLMGSSVADINSVSLVMTLSILLWSVLQSRMRLFSPYTPVACLIDFLLSCGAILFATTLYSSSPWLLNMLLLLPAAIVFVTCRTAPFPPSHLRPPAKNGVAKQSPQDRLPFKPFVTHYRASMLIVTCVAILAVDFRVFPRRFAKVENWGTSLMDLGVGSFVFTSGVVSVRAWLKTEATNRPGLWNRLVSSFRHSLPLLVLGVIRLISVKGLDYAEHVTEYGVHWNFFFTLGFLPPFVAFFQSAFDIVPSYAVLSCVLGVLYEIALDNTRLKAYILIGPRTNLLSQNREGIFSFLGYLAIFLAGQSVGSFILPRQQSLRKDASIVDVVKHTTLGKLMFSALIWSTLFYVSISYYGFGLSVSRRLANLPYFLWVTSFNTAQLALCCAIEHLCFPNIYKAASKEEEVQRSKRATSPILFAFNRNGLIIFLVANLLTGLVNLTMPTLRMGDLQSMAILVAYITIIAGFALVLNMLDVSIKL